MFACQSHNRQHVSRIWSYRHGLLPCGPSGIGLSQIDRPK
jgi:hypothetical protein